MNHDSTSYKICNSVNAFLYKLQILHVMLMITFFTLLNTIEIIIISFNIPHLPGGGCG